MHSLWNDAEAAGFHGELGQRVYTSRLLGRDKSLVLHGGGNTSVKIREKNIVGDDEDILYVKGSGRDLETIDESGFSPVMLNHLVRLSKLDSLSDPEMLNEMVTHMTRAAAPSPSVEAILHAVIPHKYVDHTHADAVLAITNTLDGDKRVAEIYGDRVVVIDYVMPGFDLSRMCAKIFPAKANAGTIGMVLLKHGIFSFGDSAKESYERMIELVDAAEKYLSVHARSPSQNAKAPKPASLPRLDIAELRKKISDAAERPMVVRTVDDTRAIAFTSRDDLESISQQGPATPDHVIRTKRLPLIGDDVDAYATAYREYFARNAGRKKASVSMLDPAPRVVLDSRFGLAAAGASAREALIVADIYSHTIDVIESAERLGGYRALGEEDIFDMEYWDLEQAKLRDGKRPLPLAGEVALVTGAASGIGRACVESLLTRGAAVTALDIDSRIGSFESRSDFTPVIGDVTSQQAISAAVDACVRSYGGLDILILNAGTFNDGAPISRLDGAAWRRMMDLNLDANLALMREAYPLLKIAPRGGRVVVIGSKNVPAPGAGQAAYSASKAALTQLARVAALEWGADNIRINTLHPNAVFDTAIWTDEVLTARAAEYGLSVEEYRRNNVLKTEVTSRDVAELAVEMCGTLFAKTTGAQIPIDGGNVRVI